MKQKKATVFTKNRHHLIETETSWNLSDLRVLKNARET